MLVAGIGRAQENADVPRRIRESVTLETNSAVAKKFGTVQDYLSAKQWNQAVDLLADISTQHGEILVSVGPGRYVNVARQCQQILAAAPEEALAVYRRQVDPQARQWLEQGMAGDEAALERIVRQAFVSSYGDDALTLLAEKAWDRGDLAAARRLWEQLIPSDGEAKSSSVLRYPDPSTPRAELAARLVLCSVMAGEVERARHEIAVFATQHGDAEGTIAGQTGNLATILRGVSEQARGWTFPVPDNEASTFAMTPERTRVVPHAVEVGGSRWSVPLATHQMTLPASRLALHRRNALCYFPLVYRDMVLVNDDERIFAWKLFARSAKDDLPVPAWPRDGDDSGLLWEMKKYRRFERKLGTPRFTMSLANGRLYAKMGETVTGRSKNDFARLESALVCLDLTGAEGREVWVVHAEETLGDGWAFDGSPLVDREHVYVVARKSQPQMQLNVACFHAVSGNLLWNRKVCTAVAPLADANNLVTHLLLTRGDDALFLSTDLGALLAIDPRDGTLRWATTYEGHEVENDAVPSDHSLRGLQPCVSARGLVLAAPSDFSGVMALESSGGAIRWERRLKGGVRHILGVTGMGTVIVSGERLWALDLRTGQVRWHLGNDEPGEGGYGRGVLAGDLVYWPKRLELLMVRQADGAIQSRRNLRALHGDSEGGGGNLTIADGTLLIAQPDRLTAFGEYGVIKSRTEKELSARPEDPRLWLRLANVEEGLGDRAAAIVHAGRAAALIARDGEGSDRGLRDALRSYRLRLLLAHGRAESDGGRGESALHSLREAAALASDPATEIGALRELSRAAERHGDMGAAAAAWQTILDRPDLASQRSVVSSSRPFGQTRVPIEGYARQELNRLAERRREAAGASGNVSPRLEQEPEKRDDEVLEALLRSNPPPGNASALLRELTDQLVDEGDAARAVILLNEFMRQPPFRAERASLQRRLDSLRSELGFPGESVGGQPDRPEDPVLWRTKWSGRAEGDLPLLVPANAPAAWQCVLQQNISLSCLRLDDGAIRWSRGVDRPVRWSAFSAIHLLIGTDASISALSPDSGALRWTVPLPDGESNARAARSKLERESRSPQYFADESRVIVFDRGERVFCLDSWTGRLRWEFLPHEPLLPAWLATSRLIAVQGESSGRTIQIDPASGESTDRSHRTEREAWRADPVAFGENGIAAALRSHRLIGVPPSENSKRLGLPLAPWKYEGPISWSNVPPAILSHGETLLAVIDGNTLCRLDPESGGRRWSRPAARTPMKEPHRSMVVSDHHAFLAADGFVRAVELDQGALVWETFVGAPESASYLTAIGNRLVVLPSETTGEGEAHMLRLEQSTGRIEQSLRINSADKGRVEVTPRWGRPVVQVGRSIQVFGPL
ncbi:MAG: PQQ-binding-like beta-propeller repeat protein [Planctomycetaceae bacterium]|nr:PQQ-binding-like beta-propeller repeat protein [Planctomycetaceae bacterium]